jgi:hypothetical protein
MQRILYTLTDQARTDAMDERYDLEQMRREIIEDEKLGIPKDKKLSQDEIQKMLLNRKKNEKAAT